MTPHATISGQPINPIGYGMISLMHPGRVPTQDAIATLKAALDAGSNFWNASDYYGTTEYNSLHLLNAYFSQYPEDSDKVVLSVKSCIDVRYHTPLCDPVNVRSCIDKCLSILDGKCKIAVLSPARLDPNVPVPQTVQAIQEYVTAGKIGGIGLSECSGTSIRAAMQVAPIQAVEVELSLFETGITANGVVEACAAFGIPIIAYSPIGRGFLTGMFRRYEDLAEDDFRKMFPRFDKDNFDNNMQIVHAAETVAKKRKDCSVTQVALAWVCAQAESFGVSVIPIPGTASRARAKENATQVALSVQELRELNEALSQIQVLGGRYPEKHARLLSI